MAMLLYEYNVKEMFKRVRDLAEGVRNKFISDASASELLRDHGILDEAYKQLIQMLPEKVRKVSSFGKHLSWMKYRLERNEPNLCKTDIEEICQLDMPALEHAFLNWCGSFEHYDKEIYEKIGDLLVNYQLDSAVRKAFVILKDRLTKTFDLSQDIDGKDLVNQIFGNRGYLAGKIPEAERESMRNFLDGLYGLFRNRYSHAEIESEWYEVETILSAINWSLKQIDKYKKANV